jgi:hypothetical protein
LPLHSASFKFSLYHLPPIGTNPQKRPVLPPCSPFLKKRHFCLR